MSTDELTNLSRAGKMIADKIERRNVWRKKVDALMEQLEGMRIAYKSTSDTRLDELSARLEQLSKEGDILGAFREFIKAESDLACLQRALGVTIKEAD